MSIQDNRKLKKIGTGVAVVENNQCFDGQQANCSNNDVSGSHLKSISSQVAVHKA